MSTPEWSPLHATDLSGLRSLAQTCLAADGGLPLLGGDSMLRRLLLTDVSIGGRDETGDLVAAAALFADGSPQRACTWLLHPSLRRQRHLADLFRWCREASGEAPLRVALESTTDDDEAFLADQGLRRTFAEHVMRHDLTRVPVVPRPAALRARRWKEERAGAFHAAYRSSFGDRPGFPDTPEAEWTRWVTGDEDFLPGLSRVVLTDGEDDPVAFVTVSRDWIDQVGVVPHWRGRGLGAHLVARSLTALRKAGSEVVWLCVNVDNPAHDLYLSLGFVDDGLRTRFEDRPSGA